MSATQKAAKGQDVVEPKAKHSGPDFESELEFYGSYHFNFYNKAIHFVCIPLIMWSSHILLSHLTLPGTEPHLLAKGFAYQPSIAMLAAVGYQLYYLYLEPVAGATFLPWTLISYLTATYLAKFPSAGIPYSSAANPSSTPFAWLVFTSSWIAQFIGHGFFEKRAPALKDNLVQALVTAPFFVHLELLFDVLGYKPEVNKRVKRRIANRVHAMRKQDKEKARA